MNIQCEMRHLIDEDGNNITYKSSIKYLGAQLQADGKMDSEIAQKIGEAHRTFKNLKRIWNHSNISKKFKFSNFCFMRHTEITLFS